MFALRKKPVRLAETEKAKVLGAVIPFPTARVPLRLVEPTKQRSYEEVAQSLGFAPTELTRAQLLAFFDEEGIELYDYDQVSAWMTEKRKQAEAAYWYWRALREKDIITGYNWGYSREKGRWDDGFYCSKNDEGWKCRPYERLVPLHALEKVAKIEAKFGDRVKFFVSDYTDPNADPFIMVRPAMSSSGTSAEYNLVFDVWDEPGFGV